MSRSARVGALVLALAVTALATAPFAGSGNGNGASQIVFSGQSTPAKDSFDPGLEPMGFWVWCDSPDGVNTYDGPCAGSMYFYDLGLVRAVFGAVVSVGTSSVVVHVASPDFEIDCTLSADLPALKGPRNDVGVECSDPVGRDGTMSQAVVVVT